MESDIDNRQVETKYPPLPRLPMKMSGIFGVTWQLFKRGFFHMLGFNAVMIGVPMVLVCMFAWGTIGQFAVWPSRYWAPVLFAMGSMVVVLILVYLAELLFITPAQAGATYLEMNDRLDGNRRTIGALFRAIRPGLKKMYSAYWAMALCMVGIVFVSALLFFLLLPLFMLPIWYIISKMTILAATVEDKRAFDGVARAVKLYFSNFGHALGATVLFTLIAIALWLIIQLLLMATTFSTWPIGATNSSWMAHLMPQSLFAIFAFDIFVLGFMSYCSAFVTALFTDLKAREDLKEQATLLQNDMPPYQASQEPPTPQEPPAPQGPM